MKRFWLAALAAALCLLTACGAADLDEVETTVIDEEGFSLILPAAWERVEPVSEHGVCAFSGEEGELTLEIVSELGPMEYYSTEELGDMVSDSVSESLFAEEPDCDWRVSENKYTNVMRGQDASGEPLVCRLDLIMPYPSVHYYLLYLAAEDAYQANRRVAAGILDSFTVTKSAEEMYQLIQERQAAEEAARESEHQEQ